MNKFNSDFKDKVTVVGISCNDKEPAIRRAIEKFNIGWTNYMETDKLSTRYGITGFPTKILIDHNGKIIFRYDGESANFYKEVINYIK